MPSAKKLNGLIPIQDLFAFSLASLKSAEQCDTNINRFPCQEVLHQKFQNIHSDHEISKILQNIQNHKLYYPAK